MHSVFENLNMLLEGDIEAIIEISKDFVDQMNTDMPVIRTHINDGNYTDAKKYAHKLKGSAMNFNDNTLIEKFVSLESALTTANSDSALTYCDKIMLMVSDFEKLIETIQ